MERGRPILVWIIAIVIVGTTAFSFWIAYTVATGQIPLPPSEQFYFDNLATIDYLLLFCSMMLNLYAAIALFFMKRAAMYFFVTALVLSAMLTSWHLISKGWIMATAGDVVSTALGYSLQVGICLYCWWLAHDERLT